MDDSLVSRHLKINPNILKPEKSALKDIERARSKRDKMILIKSQHQKQKDIIEEKK